MDVDQPKRSKKQAQEDPVTQPAQPVTPSPAPDPSQPSGTDPSELAKKLEGMVYEDFDPLLLKQNEAAQKLEFETYDAALDEFYAKVLCLLSCLVGCCRLRVGSACHTDMSCANELVHLTQLRRARLLRNTSC